MSHTTDVDADLGAELAADRSPRGLSRRRFVQNAVAAGVGLPTVAALLDACTSGGSNKAGSGGGGGGQWGSHPTYKFTLVNHVTTNSFFTPTRYGAQDACSLLGWP